MSTVMYDKTFLKCIYLNASETIEKLLRNIMNHAAQLRREANAILPVISSNLNLQTTISKKMNQLKIPDTHPRI